jgi:N-hydroxyarylamine O-acetyltransferase
MFSMTFDLPAYLQRIGAADVHTTDLPTLRHIAQRHALSIPFENIDALRGAGVSLALEDVQRKLVFEHRGGWCFEQNLLLGEALRALGFTVRDLAGRVLWNRPLTDKPARTHRMLEVHCAGRRWLVDAGFGGQTLTGIMDMDERAPQTTPHELFRLREWEGDLLLEALPAGVAADGAADWHPLYRFDCRDFWPIDFEAANFQLAHDPRSRFARELNVALPTPSGRWSLRNRELTWRGLDGQVRRSHLTDAAAVRDTLREHFGIDVGGLADFVVGDSDPA